MRLLLLLIYLSPAFLFANPVQEFTLFVEAERQHLNIPGVAIAIIDKGEVTYLNFGLAYAGKSDRVTNDTLFELASISKPITATAIMRLVELGLVSLDAPISSYIKPWKLPASEYDNDEVTLRRIMSHTAGLSGRSYQGFPVDQKLPSIEDSLNGIPLASSKVELIIEPGTQYKYSGGGFTLAQLAIERVTHRSYAEFMTDEIFKPLGMTNTTVHSSSEPVSVRSASPHDFNGKPIEIYRLPELAAGGVKSTSKDLANFALSMMGDSPILSTQSISQLSTSVIEINSNLAMALGFELRDGMLSHGGQNRGWISSMDISPSSQSALIILTNSESGVRLIDQVRCIWNSSFGIETLTRYCADQARAEKSTSWILKLASLVLLILTGLIFRRLAAILSSRLFSFTSNSFRVVAGTTCLFTILGMWFVLLTDLGVYLFAGIRWGFPTIEYLPPDTWLVTISLTMFGLVGGAALLLNRKAP